MFLSRCGYLRWMRSCNLSSLLFIIKSFIQPKKSPHCQRIVVRVSLSNTNWTIYILQALFMELMSHLFWSMHMLLRVMKDFVVVDFAINESTTVYSKMGLMCNEPSYTLNIIWETRAAINLISFLILLLIDLLQFVSTSS